MSFFLNNSQSNKVIDFLSVGLDIHITDQEYTLITREDIDINHYKVAKQFKLYKDSTNLAFLDDKNISWLKDVSNISFFAIEEAQQLFFKSSFDNILDLFFKKF